jgi:lysophospholipase L1-like esterase
MAWSLFAAAPLPTPKVDAAAPLQKQDDGRFLRRHASFLQRAKEGPIGVLFLGDSITANWSKVPQIWDRYYGSYQPANFGIPGDCTQHVLWRITNGELDGISPKVVVLMLGTNNVYTHTGAEIAAANKRIVHILREKLPDARVLVLGIFPRGPRKAPGGGWDDGVKAMEIVREANRELAALDDGDHVRFLDIGAAFLAADGTLPEEVMPDQLHLSPKGYEIWATALQPLLQEMLGKAAP